MENIYVKTIGRYLAINELVRFYDIYQTYQKVGNQYYNEWLEKLKNNEYEISFPSYFLQVILPKWKYSKIGLITNIILFILMNRKI